MDILMIGANGFAKVVDPDLNCKVEIELKFLLNHFNTSYPIPEEFKEICWYKVQLFHCGSDKFSELVLVYNDMLIKDWACDIDYHEKFDRFWAWYKIIESINLQSNEITKGIEKMYMESMNMKKND